MKTTLKHLVNVVALTGFAIFIFVILAPDVKEGQREARIGMAYSGVRLLRDKLDTDARNEPTELEDRDPWGNAYIVQAAEDGSVRVTSPGPDGVFDSQTAGSDDIWTDMPTSPLEPFHDQRRQELVRAAAIGLLTWFAFLGIYWWNERVTAKRDRITPRGTS